MSIHAFETVLPLDSTRVTLQTVVAVFNPGSTSRILFGAHWDTRPVADSEEDESLRVLPVPGANDGASGVAVLLEVATALATVPPEVGVDLVLFDGEDAGIHEQPETFALGSARFVEDHPTYRPALVVILDMVGKRGLKIPKEQYSVAGAAPVVERVWQLGRDLGLTVLADTLGPPVYDDHIAFLRAGIPAIDLIDLDDPHWHTTRDLPENCAPESLDEVGRLVLEIVRMAEESLSP